MNAQSTKAKSMSEAEAILEKSGFNPVSCDEQGIHFLARKPISVQHRTRLGVYKRNVGRDLHMCFPVNKDQDPPRWYLVPHDKLMKIVNEQTKWRKYECLQDTRSWKERREYTIENPSRDLIKAIAKWGLQT